MAEEPKPYRVYRGGRARGKVPSPPRPARQRKSKDGGPPRYAGPGPGNRPRSRWRWLRWVGVGFVLFLLWLVAWGLASYFSFRDGVKAANARLPRTATRALVDQSGLLI